ncbi:L-serine ammonia-lyase, iron-sulfur-dependent subunit beta [Lachnoclostridium sp. Marseille-P6806]|uniref:L-serine ammonia-lyase, iron-sulfur-dependent subunit beta n=1 Tax=Lachnoclostridium sp. Marseille-P6806 TaxID=2364793 RepID=UPI00102F4170|nr:L-serine ammonia-lyase, iron-sulfur-dependent subunit beta [Lachnoclostridium sp. Marseille-P6806]
MDALDMIGPIMIGPSSSHTAGAVRLGCTARLLLQEEPAEADITLYNSFADTGRGHGTDRAIVAGLLGVQPDDTGIPDSFETARERGLQDRFQCARDPEYHPNTARISLVGSRGGRMELLGASVGGGSICVRALDGLETALGNELETLVVMHRDQVGVILELAGILSEHGINIAAFRTSRSGRGEKAVTVIEVDGEIPGSCMERLCRAAGVRRCVRLPKRGDF